jgi:hypothetical protein
MVGPNAYGGRHQRRSVCRTLLRGAVYRRLVTALGLGFILNDSTLTGLIIVFIGVAALGYYLVQRRTGP